MTRVFVYHNLSDRLSAACGLLAQTFLQGKDAVVYAPDPERAQWIDRMLWAQSPLSFIPHCRVDAPLAAETPVLIAERPEQLENLPATHSRQRLFNLDDEVPPGFTQYTSLIELVGQDAQDRHQARQRAQRYKAMGCEIKYIDKTER